MADYFGYNENYLIKTFKKNTGMTPLQYFNLKKIERAEELLLIKDMKITTIADILHFDYYSFIRLFKKSTGMTPSEFRKKTTPSWKPYLEYRPDIKINDD